MADRRVSVTIDADISPYTRGLAAATAETKAFSREVQSSGKNTEKMRQELKSSEQDLSTFSKTAERSGSLLADAAAVFGTSLVPVAAAAVPVVAGLAAQLGAAGLAAGASVLAFQGVGDALKALDAYQLAPTSANLAKMRTAMAELAPAGRDFVRELEAMRPALAGLRSTAQAGLFPGLTAALLDLETRLPEVEQIIASVSATLGHLAEEAATSLAGPEWDGFFAMIENQAKPTLTDMGHILGDVTAGIGDLMVAFAPMNREFSRGMVGMARSFHDWAAGLSQTRGFAEFVAYVEHTGPEVVHTVESLARAVVDIGTAAAPLGGTTLHAIQALADAVGAIARSDLGTPIFAGIAALALYRRALALTETVQASAFAVKALPKLRSALAPVITDIETVATSWMTAGARSEREMARMGAASARLRATLAANLGKSLELTAIIEGVKGLDAVFYHLMHYDIGNSPLMHGLQTLATTGHATGELAKTYGSDLDKFGKLTGDATSGLEKFTHTLFGWVPGKDQFEIATGQIQKTDDALAQLVNSGHARQAKAAFDQLAAAAAKHGTSLAELRQLMPRYTQAAGQAAATTQRGSAADRSAAAAAKAYAQAIRADIQAMKDKRTASLAAGDAEIAYQQALDDARKAAAQNGKTLDITTQKGRDNMTALHGIAAAWNNLSDRQQNARGAFAAARSALVDQATQMGATRKQAERYAAQLLDIPSKRQTLIQVNGVDPAIASVRQLKAYIDSLHDKTITTYLRQITTHGSVAGGGHPTAVSADGSTVPKDGGPYADRYPYLLAPGEEVISNRYGQADRHRQLLKAINAGRLANGGTAGTDGLTAAERKKKLAEEAAKRKAAAAKAKSRRLSIQGYENSFDLYGGMSIRSLNHELDSFALSVHRIGGHLAADFGQLSKRARSVDEAYLRNAETLKNETKLRDNLIQQRDQAVSSATGAFTSDIFSGGLGGLSFNLSRDTERAKAMQQALATAKTHGLSGGLAQGLAASGNLQLAQQIAGLSAAQIAGLEKQYAARQVATAQLGQTTASFFAPQIAAANAQIKASQAEMKRLNVTLNRLEHAIETGSFKTVQQNFHGHQDSGKVGRETARVLKHHGKGR